MASNDIARSRTRLRQTSTRIQRTSESALSVVTSSPQGGCRATSGAPHCSRDGARSPALARTLALPPTGSFATVQTANGAVRAPVVRLRTLELGTNRVSDVQAIVHDALGPQVDGILGLNFLNRFRYAIDPERRELSLE